MLKENGDKISSADKEAIEQCVKELKEASESNDTARIKEKTEALQNASMKMGEAMYKAAQAQQGAEQPAGDNASQKDEEVVDADYEEVKK
jgi:molecular chaperone DnaK